MGSHVIILIVVSGFLALATQLSWVQSKLMMKKVTQTRSSVQLASAMETFLIAYRSAAVRYVTAAKTNNCATANPFLEAMASGSVATGLPCPDVTLFTGNDMGSGTLYSYPSAGCTISANSSTCKTLAGPVVTIGVGAGNEAQKIQGYSFSFSVVAIRPEKNELEMLMEITPPDGQKTFKNGFAVRAFLPNAAHLEVDGRVTQEARDPLARCPGLPWADYLVFNPSNGNCEKFAQLGSGTGLAMYGGRFFGFRPMDGQVIDLLAATNAAGVPASYLVNPADGTVDGTLKIFVPYSKDLLVNVDDLTLIDKQIYYVAGSGINAHIGVLDARVDPVKRLKICDLGADGWGQAYSGITALSWSDPLIPPAAPDTDGLESRMATFYLKTDSGDLLTSVIIADADGTSFQCSTIRDPRLQAVEFKRTLGFDRTELTKPYYVY